MFDVGYVQTLICEDCDVKIIDYKLVENYYSKPQSVFHREYVSVLGVGINKYDIKYGLEIWISSIKLYENRLRFKLQY